MKFIHSFLLGIFGAIGALILEILILSFFTSSVQDNGSFYGLLNSIGYLFFAVILIEEAVKYIFILKAVSRISQGKNLVLNCLLFGLGFSSLELFLNYWNFGGGINFFSVNLIGIIIIHSSTSILMGYFIGNSVGRKLKPLIWGFVPAVAIHAFYNILRVGESARSEELIIGLIVFLFLLDLFLLTKRDKLQYIQ